MSPALAFLARSCRAWIFWASGTFYRPRKVPCSAPCAFEVLCDGLDGQIRVVALIKNVRGNVMDFVAMLTNNAQNITSRQLLDLDVEFEPKDHWFVWHCGEAPVKHVHILCSDLHKSLDEAFRSCYVLYMKR